MGFRPGKTFLPITPLQVSLSFPRWALKFPSRTTESLGGALCSTADRDAKKVGYSALIDSQRPVPDLKAQGCDPLIHCASQLSVKEQGKKNAAIDLEPGIT
ncbi:hypothetical protein ATANTOWER_029133 [Ataeniobius toweri]|uniref:Uncharacterized protein n=1 Tax=Ataeniobius toweri TaxID=208326 RepID=A0ABU7BCQ7_9TELE|nr:hypothetical protein [Ataeniobius toweri]